MRERGEALIATAVVAAIIIAVLMGVHMYLPTPWPPEPHPATELVEIDPEFVELFTPGEPAPTGSAKPAENSAPTGSAKPAETTAPTGSAKLPLRTSPNNAALTPAPTAASELAKNAFASQSVGAEASTPNAATEAGNTTAGNTTGSVGGGWKMPGYAKVRSYSTGSVILSAVVDRQGHVTSVTLIGGKAPASGDTELVARCIAEVRRHRFTRDDDDAPESAVARIVYSFK